MEKGSRAYEKKVEEFARRKHVHPRTALLLAGVGVTHEFVPRKGERPGLYGATAHTTRSVVPKRRRERTRRGLMLEEYERELAYDLI